MRAFWGRLVLLAGACGGTDPDGGSRDDARPTPPVVEFSEPVRASGLRPLVMLDLNGDGRMEIVTGEETGMMLAIHTGNPERDPTVMTAWGNLPVSEVTFADVNGDDITDLVAGSYGARRVSVVQGLGDGTFAATPVQTTTTLRPSRLALTNFDADPAIDLVVQEEFDGSSIELYGGNGDGTFATPSPIAVPLQAVDDMTHVFAEDLNGDSQADLLIATRSKFLVMLGNGDGTFQMGWSRTSGLTTDSFVYADVDGDGRRDLLFSASSVMHFAPSLGDGTFGEPELDHATTARATEACDLDGDGTLDLVTSSISSIRWNLGRGDGTFHETREFPFDLPSGVICGDFDGDENNDLVVFNKFRTGIEIYFRL
jgi:hypothetical protein